MRSFQAIVVPFAFLMLMIGSSAGAWAQGVPNQAAAQALFDEGMRLFAEANFQEACGKFEASLALVEAMGTRGKLAECYEKDGRTASAWATYREVAVLAGRAGQTRRQEVASERALRLEKTLSYLTILVPAAARVPDIHVTRNGILVSPGAYDTAIAVDPGEQAIAVSASGYQPWAVKIAVASSAKETIEVVALQKLPEARVEPGNGLPISRDSKRKIKRTVGISAVAVGGIGLLVSFGLGLKANSDYQGAFDDGLCDEQNRCSPEGTTITGDARSLANIGTAVGVTGAVIAGVGAYLWFTADPKGHRDTMSAQLVPDRVGDAFGLSLNGQF